jgi:hypothetical protein
MEFYMENLESFNQRLKNLKHRTASLTDFDETLNFNNFDSFLQNIPVKQELKAFKFELKEDHELGIKSDLAAIMRIYPINIYTDSHQVEIKINLFIDFLLGGSMKLLLLKKENLLEDKIKDCLGENSHSCSGVISNKINKSHINLSSVLLRGEYYLLFINNINKISFDLMTKKIDYNYIPLSMYLEINEFRINESKFSCEGRNLPDKIEILDDSLSANSPFKLNGEFILNISNSEKKSNRKYINLQVKETSLLQLITLTKPGENLNIKFFTSVDNEEIFITQGKVNENHVGLFAVLMKNKSYQLLFQFEEIIIDENSMINNFNSCPEFNMKLSITPMNLIQSKNCNEESDKEIERYLNDVFSTSSNNFYNKNSSVAIQESKIFNIKTKNLFSLHELFKKEIQVNTMNPLIFYAEVVSPLNLIFSINKNKNLMSYNNSYHSYLNKGKNNIPITIMSSLHQFEEIDIYKNELLRNLPECINFTIRSSKFILDSKINKNWKCKNEQFDLLPNIINLSDAVHNYFSKDVLVPLPDGKNKIQIKTSNLGYLLQMKIEDKNNLKINMKIKGQNINSKKNSDNDNYLFYYFEPNQIYEVEIESEGLSLHEYYEKCLKMSVMINLTPNNKLKQCSNGGERIIPKIEDLIFERIVGKEKSYYKYKSKNITQILLNSNSGENAPVLSNPDFKNNIFSYKLIPNENFTQKFDFEIKSFAARLSAIIDIQEGIGYSFISASIYKKGENLTPLETTHMDDQGRMLIKGLALNYGEFTLLINDNNQEDDPDKPELKNKIVNSCIKFSVRIFIENMPYDNNTQFLQKHSNSCNLMSVPRDIHVPGLLSFDAGYSINDSFKFKISDKNRFYFRIEEDSSLNFYLTKTHSNLLKSIELIQHQEYAIAISLRSSENYISHFLQRGTYTMTLNFDFDNSNISSECNEIILNLSIQPLPSKNKDISKLCDSANDSFIGQIFPNTEYNNEIMNIKAKKDGLYYFTIQPLDRNINSQGGKFYGKLIRNNLVAPITQMKVYKIKSRSVSKSINSVSDFDDFKFYEEIQVENYFDFSSNSQSIKFNTIPGTYYILRFIPTSTDCSLGSFSYVFEESQREAGLNEAMTTIEKEEERNVICEVSNYLPGSLNNLFFDTDKLNFYGEFLFPKGIDHVKSTFSINKKSLVYIKIFNKKSKEHFNSFVEIFNIKSKQRVAHSESDGILFSKIENIQASENNIEYSINISFEDREGENDHCATYEIIIQIIPIDSFLPKSCNNINNFSNSIAHSIQLNQNNKIINLKDEAHGKSYFYYHNSKLKLSDNLFEYNQESKTYEYIFEINIENKEGKDLILHSYIHLDYPSANNSMDIVLSKDIKNLTKNIFEKSSNKISPLTSSQGVIEEKKINSIIVTRNKDNKYYLKLIFDKLYIERLENLFDDEIDHKLVKSFCFPFNLKMIFLTRFKTEKKNEKNISNENSLLFIDPPSNSNLILSSEMDKFKIEFEFSENLNELRGVEKKIWLQEETPGNNKNKISPFYVHKSSDTRLEIQFLADDIKENCYKLVFDIVNVIKNFKPLDNQDYKYCFKLLNREKNNSKLINNKIKDEEITNARICEGQTLPTNFYDEENSYLGESQKEDSSINISTLIKLDSQEQSSEFSINEKSVISIFMQKSDLTDQTLNYELLILDSIVQEKPLAILDKNSPRIITHLLPRKLPYYLVIKLSSSDSSNISNKCTLFNFRFSIKPYREIQDSLKCPELIQKHKSDLNLIRSAYLPSRMLFLGDGPSSELLFQGKEFFMIGSSLQSQQHEIEIKVMTFPVYAVINVSFNFMNNDMYLILKSSRGEIISTSHFNNNFNEKITFTLEYALKANTEYKLVIIRNGDLQLENDSSKLINCFNFEMSIQSTIMLSADESNKNENKIINVQPESVLNLRSDQKLEITIEFEKSVFNKDNDKTLISKEMFVLMGKNSIHPNNLKKINNKTIKLIFNKNSLENNSCYTLNYNPTNEVFKGDTGKNLEHKYCTTQCNCNPSSDFECDHKGHCLCLEPYTGLGCNSCIQGYVMINGVCVSKENCREKHCSGYGTCKINKENNPLSQSQIIKCTCDEGFSGDDCSQCEDKNKNFPNCYNNLTLSTGDDIDFSSSSGQNEISDVHKENYESCRYDPIINNLDTFGFLKSDGNTHFSGLYSLKHNIKLQKHFEIKFTIKEESHVKFYLEHSNKNFIANLSLFKYHGKDGLLKRGSLLFGPGGKESASLIEEKNLKPNFSLGGKIESPYILIIEILDLEKGDHNYEECFDVFLEMQISKNKPENKKIKMKQTQSCPSDKLPNFIFQDYNFERLVLQNKEITIAPLGLSRYNIKITNEHLSKNTKYNLLFFHSQYIYLPNINSNFKSIEEVMSLHLNIESYSSFLNSQIGILIEVLPIPHMIGNKLIDFKKITNNDFELYLKLSYNNSKILHPNCEENLCFSGVKKYNGNIIRKSFPSISFLKIWFYTNELNASTCLTFDFLFELESKIIKKKQHDLMCNASLLPSTLNIKGYLGDVTYLQKWGFHILDRFVKNISHYTGSVHRMEFSLSEYHLLRLKIYDDTDVDVHLFFANKSGEEFLLTRLYKGEISIELPPGKYYLIFKFYNLNNINNTIDSDSCHDFLMELSMAKSTQVQENVDRLIHRHNNKPIFKQINLFDILSKNHLNDEERFLIPIERSKNINLKRHLIDYKKILIDSIDIEIDHNSESKLELFSSTSNDFLLLNAEFILTEKNSNNNNGKSKINTLSSDLDLGSYPKKNLNVLDTSLLKRGIYTLSLVYSPRLHFKDKQASLESISLKHVNFLEIELKSVLINKSNDVVEIKTNKGILKIPPSQSESESDVNLQCENNLSINKLPHSLNNLRYLEFNSDMHILDSYLVPNSAHHSIKFRINLIEKMMFRIYIECFNTDIDIRLYLLDDVKEKKLIQESKSSTIFETISEIIRGDKEYELMLIFNHSNERENSHEHFCKTFKMEIATEVQHSFACPENSSTYKRLDQLNTFLPSTLPKDVNFSYDSRNFFKGEGENSGYLYLLRNKHDEQIKFIEFTAQEEIDIKVELINDFIQAPINPYLISGSKLSSEDDVILTYGEMYENRNILFLRNVPPGHYIVVLHVPGLKTLFEHERTVCSMYDVIVNIKKSDNSNKGIINTYKDILNAPLKLPLYLNYKQFLDDNETFSLVDKYYWRKDKFKKTNSHTIEFTLKDESLVKFETDSKNISIQLGDVKSDKFSLSLPKGKHSVEIINNLDEKDNIHYYEPFNLFIGVSKLQRIHEILKYNNLKECKATKLPEKLITSPDDILSYKNDKILFKTNVRFVHIFKEIKINTLSRVYSEISADYIFNKMILKLRSKKDQSILLGHQYNNLNVIDEVVNPGEYEIILMEDSSTSDHIVHNQMKCGMFSLDISVIKINFEDDKNNEKSPCGISSDNFPISILPNEIILDQKNSNYNLSLENVIYSNKILDFDEKTSSNSILIKNLENNSVSDKYLLKLALKDRQENKNIKLIPKLSLGSNLLQESFKMYNYRSLIRDTLWVLNSQSSSQSKLKIITKNNEDENRCIKYGLDLQLEKISNLNKLLSCPSKNNKVYEYKQPKNEISIGENKYSEILDISYFTIKEYRKNFKSDESEEFSYQIKLNLKNNVEYNISLEFAFYYLISDFEIKLIERDIKNKPSDNTAYRSRLLAYSERIYDNIHQENRKNILSHKSILNAKIHKKEDLEFYLLIKEKSWHKTNTILNSESEKDNSNINLCLPFSYSLKIFPFNILNSDPEIISISPSSENNLIILQSTHHLSLTIILNKPFYNNQGRQIKEFKDYENISQSFYLSDKTNQLPFRIHPDKVEQENEVEWRLTFHNKHLVSDLEYQLNFDYEGRKLFDYNKKSFKCNIKMPSFKLDNTSKEENLFFDTKELKKKMEDIRSHVGQEPEFKEENSIGETSTTSSMSYNCGVHGKFVYDKILNKKVCTCFDGYSGKKCDFCSGKEKFDVKSKKTICLEEDVERKVENINNLPLHGNKSKLVSMCKNCVNGTCDEKFGNCICYPEYTGDNCDKKINNENESEKSFSLSGFLKDLISFNNSFIKVILQFGIFFMIIFTLSKIYSKIRSSDRYSLDVRNGLIPIPSFNNGNSYMPVPAANEHEEFEMATSRNLNSINSINLSLEENNLIDY